MADVNYTNAGAMAPQYDWKPRGFLAGMMAGDQQQDYRQSMDMSHQLQNLNLLKQRAQYGDYLSDAPLRQSARDLGVATNTAQTPIQGDLAGAAGATARATSQTAPSNAAATVFKNDAHKRAYGEELVSNYLGAVLQQAGNNGMVAQQIWNTQAVPALERAMGEPVPDKYKTMGVQEMRMLSQALTQSGEHRRAMLLQGAKDDAHMARTKAEVAGRQGVANTRGDQTTSAEVRQKAMEQYVKDRMVQGGVTEQQARIEAFQLSYGGQVPQRGAEARETDTEKRRQELLQMEKFLASQSPIGPSVPINQRKIGKIYRNGKGKYAYWTEQGWKGVE